MPGYGVGASLASYAQQEGAEANQMLATAAREEEQRGMQNKQLEAERKSGNKMLGATLGAAGGMYAGAQIGAVGGPMGALIGAAVGAIAGGLL